MLSVSSIACPLKMFDRLNLLRVKLVYVLLPSFVVRGGATVLKVGVPRAEKFFRTPTICIPGRHETEHSIVGSSVGVKFTD
jgi:hypothetical protein